MLRRALLAALPVACAQAQVGSQALTTQPGAIVQLAPDRAFHLAKSSATFDVDAEHHTVTGSVTNTFSMLRSGLTHIRFDSAVDKVSSVVVDGKPAKWAHAGGGLDVELIGGTVGTQHVMIAQIAGTVFNWYTPTKSDPYRQGFWAEGMRAIPVSWAAPNDFTATEISATVPKSWSVVSNGLKIADTPKGSDRHTVVWRMEQPHANYLTSIVAGPYDIRTDKWRDKQLIMTCPKGYGDRLEYAFANTKDILTYFSDVLGVDYPWLKYAQTVIYDHPYGEEDVNATIYPMYWGQKQFLSLANRREGQHLFEWVIAHETAHQWFGDYVTCKDWSHTWLNEGITTFMEMMYTRHSRGEQESLRQVEAYSQRYFGESRRYIRPVVTNVFSNQGDYHTYYKGGTLMMSLRKLIGDEAFFRGLHRYLTRRGLSNVETNDLCEDMTDACGINLHPWFDQWIYSPGHPVVSWSWAYDTALKQVSVRVQQTQDTSKGTPVFDVITHVGIAVDSKLRRESVHLNAKDQTFTFPAEKSPQTVLFDPDHEFLREIPTMPWTLAEMPYVLRLAPNPVDRAFALDRLVDSAPDEATLRLIASVLRSDLFEFPGLTETTKLAALKRPTLHDFWVAETTHPNDQRRANAATGLAGIANSPTDFALLNSLLKDDQPYLVVAAALRGLAATQYGSIRKLALDLARSSPSSDVREAALDVIADTKEPGYIEAILATASDSNPTLLRYPGVKALRHVPKDDPRLLPSLRSAVQNGEPSVAEAAREVAATVGLKL